MAGRMAERWYARLSTMLTHELRGRQALVLYGSSSQFRQTNVDRGRIRRGHRRRHGSVQAPYRPALRRSDRGDRSRARPRARPRVSVRHHQHQRELGRGGIRRASCRSRCGSSKEWPSICRSVRTIRIPRCGCATRSAAKSSPRSTIWTTRNIFPYRYGQALWAFIGGKYGDRMAGSLLRAGVGRDGYKGAFERVLGVTDKELSQQWHDATVAAFRPIAEATKMPGRIRPSAHRRCRRRRGASTSAPS